MSDQTPVGPVGPTGRLAGWITCLSHDIPRGVVRVYNTRRQGEKYLQALL